MAEFEDLRAQQGTAYRSGQYQQAIELGTQAFYLAEPDSLEAASTARDVAAACLQRGSMHDPAGIWIGTFRSWIDTSLRILGEQPNEPHPPKRTCCHPRDGRTSRTQMGYR